MHKDYIKNIRLKLISFFGFYFVCIFGAVHSFFHVRIFVNLKKKKKKVDVTIVSDFCLCRRYFVTGLLLIFSPSHMDRVSFSAYFPNPHYGV